MDKCDFDIDEVDSDELITTLEEWSGWKTSRTRFLLVGFN